MTASSTSSFEAVRGFLLRLAVFGAVSLCVWTACTAGLFNGYTDDYYERISSPRQSALILGTSRAAQGLVPEEIDARSLGAESPLYNFAFASSLSRFGPTYLRAIERKLRPPRAAGRGLFLLEVSPLAISTARDAPSVFPEDQTFLGKLHGMSLAPNIEYPFYVSSRGYNIIERTVRRWRGRVRLLLHADGWLEVTPVEEGRVEANVREKLEDYRSILALSQYSPERAGYLERTLELLTPLGRTALVSLPIDPRLRALDRDYMPDFEAHMRKLAESFGASYIDLSDLDGRVASNDGSHLRRDGARQVSRELSARLLQVWGGGR